MLSVASANFGRGLDLSDFNDNSAMEYDPWSGHQLSEEEGGGHDLGDSYYDDPDYEEPFDNARPFKFEQIPPPLTNYRPVEITEEV